MAADRPIHGKLFFFYRGNGDGPPETFKIFACSESTGISQTLNEIIAETNCDRVAVDGTFDRTVDFSLIPVLEASAGKVSIANLQEDFDAGAILNYKITTAAADVGDPIFSFAAKITDLNYEMSASDFFKGSGSLRIDGDLDITFVV